MSADREVRGSANSAPSQGFPADGYIGTTAYMVLSSGRIAGLVNGQRRIFESVESFIEAVNASDRTETSGARTPPPPTIAAKLNFEQNKLDEHTPLKPRRSSVRAFLLSFGIFIVTIFIFQSSQPPQNQSTDRQITPTNEIKSTKQKQPENPTTVHRPANSYSPGAARLIVDLLNSQYGGICEAKLEGWISKTLRIDWTSRTMKLHVIRVLAEIGSVKELLYADGVRYLKFPNDAGGYNIIDWKTGEKTSVDERARYYFTR